MPLPLDSVHLFATDIHAARPFYFVLLGLLLGADGSDHGFCVVQCGAAQLVLETVSPDAPADEQALVSGILATFCDPSGHQLQRLQRPAAAG